MNKKMSSSNVIVPLNDDEIAGYPDENRILIFSTSWCGPCKTYKKMWQSEATKNPDIKFIYINTDDCPDTAAYYGVVSIPTTIVLNMENEVSRFGGAKIDLLQNAISMLKLKVS